MLLVNIIGKLDEIDKTLEKCSVDDNFHVENAFEYIDNKDKSFHVNEENPYNQILLSLDNFSSDSGFIPDEKALNIDFNIDKEAIINYNDKLSKKITPLINERNDLFKENETNEIYLNQLKHFTGLDVDLDDVFACEFIKVRFGKIPKDSYQKLSAYKDNPYMLFFQTGVDNTHYWGVYFSPFQSSSEIDRIFSHLYFERLRVTGIHGTAEVGIEQLTNKIEQNSDRISVLNDLILTFWEKELPLFSKFYYRARFLQKAFEIKYHIAIRNNLFQLIGYIPAKIEKEFISRFDDLSSVQCAADIPEKDYYISPPTKLKNNLFSRPFEMFINMFGLPSYYEIDPTPIVSIIYTIVFGMMYGDVGHGIILAIAGFIMYRYKKMEIGPILVRCGFSAVLFGFVFGSIFGFEHAMNPLYRVIGIGEPFELMKPENIMKVIIISIGIGISIISLAMLLNIISSLKQKNYESALFSENGLAGLMFYLSVFAGVGTMILGINILSLPYILGLIILPLILIFLKEPLGNLCLGKSDWFPKNFGEYTIQNFFEVFEYILSYISNTLSFLRLGAFALVHIGMMTVVMTLAGIFGIIGSTVTIIIGNFIVIALEGLLVGIQGLRLSYYEFFSRFYNGNGRKFISVTKITKQNQQ